MVLGLTLIGASGSSWAQGEEEKKTGWSNETQLSWVMTSGNSETSTLGFKNTAIRAWEQARFVLKAGAVRAEAAGAAFAVGARNDFIIATPSAELTAENYLIDGRYERKISDRFYWYAGLGWDRNLFAGIDSRTVAQGGVGNIWFDREKVKLKTDYALTYTSRTDVEPGDTESFAGARLTWEFLVGFGKNTTYANDFIWDYNFEESSDWRGDMLNALSVSMTDHLALRVGLRWLYENEPRQGTFTLCTGPAGDECSVKDPIPVVAPLDELDTIFSTSLVVSF